MSVAEVLRPKRFAWKTVGCRSDRRAELTRTHVRTHTNARTHTQTYAQMLAHRRVCLAVVRPTGKNVFLSRGRKFSTGPCKTSRVRYLATTRTPGTGQSAAVEAVEKVGHWEDWMVNLRGEDSWLKGPRADAWFTGKRPVYGECPGVLPDGTFTSLALPRLDQITRQGTQDYFDNTWTAYELLFAGLNGEEYFYRPAPHGLRHPQIFYYGHTPCLYVNKLRVAGVLDQPVNAYFESIYEVGVDEMLWDDMHKNDMVWPTVKETHEYRQEVYEVVSNVIATHPDIGSGERITWDHPLWALYMGFEHDRIHLETSSVLFREAPEELVQVPPTFAPMHPSVNDESRATHEPVPGVHYPAENRFISVEGGGVQLGKPRNFPTYGWDNEYGTRTVETPSFSATEFMITNGDFLEFVKDGGYRTERYWSEDGWGWRKFRNMKNPFFWELDGPSGSFRFKLRTIFETVDMQWDWPAEVNHHEAKAYCAWKGEKDGRTYRLPTESEWNLMKDPSLSLEAARNDPMADPVVAYSGAELVRNPDLPHSANVNMAFGSASPVGSVGPKSASGHYDIMGNVWEHAEDNFNPLEEGLVSYVGGQHLCNYKIHPVYDDFSMPCYDGRHDMILGGSFMSTGDEASTFSRFHFRRHFLQHSGFRMVHSNGPVPAAVLEGENNFEGSSTVATQEVAEENIYETKALVDQYLDLHYAGCSMEDESIPFMMKHEGLPAATKRFPQRVAELLFELDGSHNDSVKTSSLTRVLDLGCAVGGSSYTLATKYDEVVGVDFSQAFIDAANSMKSGDKITYDIAMEGTLTMTARACHEENVDEDAMGRTHFQQGDACNLNEAALGQFDSVVMANLLCRLPKPHDCLDSISRMVKPGGLVVLTTPFSWLEQFTPKDHWIGGYVDLDTNEAVDSQAALQKAMEARGFSRVYSDPIPLVIREHQRKYQYIIADATGWRKEN